MKKCTIIIPTMWFHVEKLKLMLSIYNDIQSVGEILIVDNDSTKTPELSFSKVRLIGDGTNLFVNPSWLLGVKEAKFESVVLVNDDIIIKDNLNSLFENIICILCEGRIVGADVTCYTNVESKLALRKRPVKNKLSMGYGYGVFMFVKKSTFLNTPIPNDIKVWYGDHILYYKNEAWCFSGVKIETAMRGTTSRINLSGVARKEKMAFYKYLKLQKV